MDCAAEEQIVRMRLAEMPDVQEVDVDLDTRTVTVSHDRPTDDLVAALDALGMGADPVSAPDHPAPSPPAGRSGAQRSALLVALAINAAFFVGELAAGLLSGSMGLLADSLDMLADASVYALSLVAVGQVVSRQRRLASASGYLQLTLAVVGLAEVLRRAVVGDPPPDVSTMLLISVLALAANIAVLLVLRRARDPGVHMQAAWIFTSNDVKANTLVIVAALAVAATESAIPDLVVGALIFVIVANGARRILRLSRVQTA